MSSIVLYIATSLDGFIAGPNDDLSWLFDIGEEDYGYADFLGGVGALVMGRRTYDVVRSFGAWPYADRPTYVFTHHPPTDAPADAPITFVSEDVASFVRDLRAQTAGDIWLMGGGSLASAFRAEGLIDEYILSIHPVLLGDGVPLFPGTPPRTDLRLLETTPYPDGLVQLRYRQA